MPFHERRNTLALNEIINARSEGQFAYSLSLLSKIAEIAWKPTWFDAAFGQAMMDFQDRAS